MTSINFYKEIKGFSGVAYHSSIDIGQNTIKFHSNNDVMDLSKMNFSLEWCEQFIQDKLIDVERYGINDNIYRRQGYDEDPTKRLTAKSLFNLLKYYQQNIELTKNK